MAKPERLRGGFELANGRAADRVSEKEAEEGRSRRRTASAAASPWHDPGLRLQRLHKETVLGAAVPLLVRGRAAGRGAERRGFKPRAPGLGLARPGTVPASRRAPFCVRTRPAPPLVGRGAVLLPLTGGPAASVLSGLSAGLFPSSAALGQGFALLWAEPRPLLSAGGWPCAPFSPEANPTPCGLGRSNYACLGWSGLRGPLPGQPRGCGWPWSRPAAPVAPPWPLLLPLHLLVVPGSYSAGNAPSPRRQLPGHRPEYPFSSLRGFPPLGGPLGAQRFSPSSHASQPSGLTPGSHRPALLPGWGLGMLVVVLLSVTRPFAVRPRPPPASWQRTRHPASRSASPVFPPPHFGRTVAVRLGQ